FEWVDFHDSTNSILVYIRKGFKEEDRVLVVANMTPVPRESYRVGCFEAEQFEVIFNSDHPDYWGSNFSIAEEYTVEATRAHYREQSLVLSLPPLSLIVLKAK
ncbi:MAG: alpha amylase C-terminal domain-containing protein, partial [Bacteroidota bacterium]